MAYKYWETQPKTVEFKGKKYRKIELAKKYGINYETFLNRLKSGWRIEKAIQNKSFIGNNQYSKK